jgi:hypothetical protein
MSYPANPAHVMLGFAYAIGFDVPIAEIDGREVRLPKGFIDEEKVMAALYGLRDHDWRSELDRYRWFCWCIAEAQREVEALGIAASLWKAPEPPARRPAPPLIAGLSSRANSVLSQPEAPEPEIRWVGPDEWHIDGMFALRGSGPSWYVVALPSQLLGWYPDHAQARAAAIEAARAARSRGVRPHSPVPFTHQVIDRGGPGEMAATGRSVPRVITRRPQQ